MNIDRIKTLSDIVASWFGLLALIAGGLFAVHQYMENEKSERIKVALVFLERFNKERVFESRMKILKAWGNNFTSLKYILHDKNFIEEKYDNFVISVVEKEGIKIDIMIVLDFYETLFVCVEKGVCDRETVVSLFSPGARRFYRIHYPYIEFERAMRGDQTFGLDLGMFVAMTYGR